MVGIAFSRSRPCNWRPVNEEASYTIYDDGDDGNFVDIGDDYERGNVKIVSAMIIWLWRVEGMIVTVGKGRRVFAEDSKQRERKMRGIILINYDHHHDDHNYHIF